MRIMLKHTSQHKNSMHGSTPVLFSPVTVKWTIQVQESSPTFDKVSDLEFTF